MSTDRGFTLVELLVVVVVAMILMTGFTGFYLSQQHALRHHQIDVETSEALRTALEQASRDIRVARKDLSGVAVPVFVTAGANTIEFQLDADDSGSVAATSGDEHKGFRLGSGISCQFESSTSCLQTCDPSNAGTCQWTDLADYVSDVSFHYWGCSTASPPVSLDDLGTSVTGANLSKIKRVDISITMSHPTVGGLPVTRTETESIQLRNVRCS